MTLAHLFCFLVGPPPPISFFFLSVIHMIQIYTGEGLELARATFVNVKGETVYDELIKPT